MLFLGLVVSSQCWVGFWGCVQGQWAVTASGSRVESLLAKTFPLLGLFFILGAETGIFIFYYRQNDGLLAPDTEGFNRFFVCVCAMNIWNWMEKNVCILYILPRWLEIKVTPPWNSVPEACPRHCSSSPFLPSTSLPGSLQPTGRWRYWWVVVLWFTLPLWFMLSTSFLSCNCFPLTLTASP